MRTDKNFAFELRKQGKTYRQIQKELGIARSTLCDWFRNEEWSRHWVQKNTKRNIQISTDRIKLLNEGRKKWLLAWYAEIDKKTNIEFEMYKKDPLFTSGLMLYAGEGDKSDTVSIKFVNCDFSLHKIFKYFMINYLEKDSTKFKFSMLLYPDLDQESCYLKWSSELNINRENFYKTQVIQGRHKTKRLQFGVGTIILVGTKYKRRLSRWIELYKNEVSLNAGIF